jgi:hypothetical protein
MTVFNICVRFIASCICDEDGEFDSQVLKRALGELVMKAGELPSITVLITSSWP